MTTAIAAVDQWDPNSGAALPAYLADAMGELGTNIADRGSVPSLSYEGKTWTIIKDGNKTKLQMTNTEGDTVPVPVMRLVVMKYNADRGRSFYEGVYNPANSSAPKCWSADGVAPDASVKEKMSAKCANCPMSVKGSKVQDGKEMVACSSHRMIAIAPAMDLTADPLRLKIAVTSDYDKEIVEHGWYAFRQYCDYLKSRGIVHTALVVTKVKFDSNTAFPKLLFAIDRPLTPDEVATVVQSLKNPKIDELLAEKWSAAGSAGTLTDQSDIAPWGLEGAYADGWEAHPDAAGYSWKGEEVLTNVELAAKYPEPKKVEAKTPPPVEKKVAPPVIIDHVDTPADPAPEAAAAAPAPIVPAHDPLANAMANGWEVHPDNPEYYFKDDAVLPTAEVMALYPAPPVEKKAPPAAPKKAPPAPVKAAPHDALAVAVSDGWTVHPDDASFYFKGDEVLAIADVEAKYPAPNGGASAGTNAAGGQASAGAASSTSTPAAAGASPSDAGVPADVQDLLSKWA